METWLAFAIIYFVWDRRFWRLRGRARFHRFVRAMRFSVAGLAPVRLDDREGERCRRAAVDVGDCSGVADFVCDYGLLFWRSNGVPSECRGDAGHDSGIHGAIRIIFWGTKLTLRLTWAAGGDQSRGVDEPLVGILAVPVDTAGAAALIVASISWSVASALHDWCFRSQR